MGSESAARLEDLLASNAYIDVELTWGIYQRVIEAYRDTDKTRRRRAMITVIAFLSQGVHVALIEIATFGRTLKKRAADVLAYFNRPRTSNGPSEAINGRLEHLRGFALGFRNLTN